MALILGHNLPDTLHKRVAAGPGRTAMLRKRQGVWTAVTWKEYERNVFEIAEGLRRAGIQEGDRVAILSHTRPEWAFADLAILSLGAITVPVYASVTADDIFYILKDSGTKFAFIEGPVQREKLEALRPRLPELKGIVSFDDTQGSEIPLLEDWNRAALVEAGDVEKAVARWKSESAALDPDIPATIVYTSGTEGLPKGVVLSHGNFLEVMRDASSAIKIGEQDLTLLFLPVAHIIGRVEQMLSLGVGWTNAYAQGPGALADNLLEVRPTVLFGVPRVYEKVRDAVMSSGGSAVRDQFVGLAMHAGRRYREHKERGAKPDRLARLTHEIFDRTVFQKVRAQFGGRLRFAISGGAPLPLEVADFFRSCGLTLLEGYGLTETTGPIAMNTPQASRLGSVGRLYTHAQMKFAADGEILLKGPTLFKGYYGKKVEPEATADGEWFRSGDIGFVDKDGYLHVTDRKKDLIITSGGKNISPVKIEQRLSQVPIISNALVAGDRRTFLTALFTLNVDQARQWCEKNKTPFQSVGDLVALESFQDDLKSKVDKVNEGLASHERIKRFRVLSREFTIEAGELTPSLKVKRNFCTRKYADLIEEMYP